MNQTICSSFSVFLFVGTIWILKLNVSRAVSDVDVGGSAEGKVWVALIRT